MSQIHRIATKKQLLDRRWDIMKQIREFFWATSFQEVETPLITAHGGQEPYLTPMTVQVMNEHKKAYNGYLHTSPEYTMKKLLAAGYEQIFFLGKTFRNVESFGGNHNPEFTMLEWYRKDATIHELIIDIEALLQTLAYTKAVTHITMKKLWKETINIDLDEYLTVETMGVLCKEKGYRIAANESYEELFYRIFLNDIEPTLKHRGAIIISGYPAQMAALAKLTQDDSRYADRIELYIDGLEIANGFSELTDGEEQRKRFQEEQAQREALGKPVFPIDEAFITAVSHMPEAAGIALGVDRLVQVLTDCQNMNDVIVLGAKELFVDS